jgi:hypothetical protein
MNKAFVRDPEPGDPRCPPPRGCDNLGVRVTDEALAVQLPAHVRRRLGDTYFCPSPHCPVVFFDTLDEVVVADELERRFYPKEPAAPVCACLGITAEDIREDAERGQKARVKRIVQFAASEEARCGQTAVTGQSCVAEVRRLFLRSFPGPDAAPD